MSGFTPSRPIDEWREEAMRRGRRRIIRKRAYQAASALTGVALVAFLVPVLFGGKGATINHEVGRPAGRGSAAPSPFSGHGGPRTSNAAGITAPNERGGAASQRVHGSNAPAPSEQTIAFVGERDGRRQIYVVNVDGSHLRRISNMTGNDFDPAWSADGARIAFAYEPGGTNNNDAPGPDSQIWVMNADGSHRTRLTTPGNDTSSCFTVYQQNAGYGPGCWDSHPSWSPDGKTIAFTRGGHKDQLAACSQYEVCPSIWTMRADGSNAKRVSSGRWPDWSAAGSGVAFDDTFKPIPNCPGCDYGDLFVMNADGTSRTDLGIAGALATWSPSGDRLAFSDPSGSVGVARRTSNGNWSSQILVGGSTPDWSPDGASITYAVGNQGIFVIGSDGSAPTKVPHTFAMDASPVFRPAV